MIVSYEIREEKVMLQQHICFENLEFQEWRITTIPKTTKWIDISYNFNFHPYWNKFNSMLMLIS
jgi:hypothetical protein